MATVSAKSRPVGAGVLGDLRAGEQFLQERRVGDRPRGHPEDVHTGGRTAVAQGLVLGVAVGTGGVEDEYGLVGHGVSLSASSGETDGERFQGAVEGARTPAQFSGGDGEIHLRQGVEQTGDRGLGDEVRVGAGRAGVGADAPGQVSTVARDPGRSPGEFGVVVAGRHGDDDGLVGREQEAVDVRGEGG